jgi:AcrR family transcriptional regulator
MEKIDLSELNISEKEKLILQAAIKLFSEKGFNNATSKEIAKEAGIAEGTIFNYFKTKKDIMSAILVHLINLVSDKIVMKGIKEILTDSRYRDIKTVLKEIIYDRMKLVDKIFPMAQIIFVEAITHEDVRDAIYTNIIKKALDMFDKFYKEMAEKGVLRSGIDSKIVFRSILGNIAILIGQKKIFGKYLKQNDIEKEINDVIDVILNGIL